MAKGEVTIMVKVMRIDEQRFEARMAALDAAVRLRVAGAHTHGTKVTDVAELFEEWLLRPVPDDVSKVDDGPARQPCGAFLQPPWFVGARWLTCSGSHRPGDDWHIAQGGRDSVIFHSHHAPDHIGPQKCACGGTVTPCPDAHPTDMHR